MPVNVQMKDANGEIENFLASGDGTTGNPYIPVHRLTDGASTNYLTINDVHISDANTINNTNFGILSNSIRLNFNGSTFDRQRGNIDTGALLTLTAQTAATVNSADQTNFNGRGLQALANLTVVGASTNVTFNFQGKDTASGLYYTILSSAALAVTGQTQFIIYPGVVAAANSIANQPLPRTWRVQAVVAGSNSVTGTLGVSVIL